MTDGERMVWAAEFVRRMATASASELGLGVEERRKVAARQATSLVYALRKLRNLDLGDYEAEAMVARMTGEKP